MTDSDSKLANYSAVAAGLLQQLVGSSLREAGDYLGDKIRASRLKNQLRILHDTKELLDKHGLQPKAVNLKVLLPLIETAALEDEPDLQRMWSNLLANAALADWRVALHKTCIDVLESSSRLEGRLLQYGYHMRRSKLPKISLSDASSYVERYNAIEDFRSHPLSLYRASEQLEVSPIRLMNALDNLARFNVFYHFAEKPSGKRLEKSHKDNDRLSERFFNFSQLGFLVAEELINFPSHTNQPGEQSADGNRH